MREILFVIGSLGVGGTERHLAMLLPRLVENGWRVSIYSLEGYGPLYNELNAGGVTVIVPPLQRRSGSPVLFSVLRLAVAAAHLFLVMLKRRPAIAHFFLPEAYLLGAPMAVLGFVPVRVMSRRSLNVYQAQRPFYRRAEYVLHRFMAAVLGNSQSVVRQLIDEGVPEERVGLIYNGIEVPDRPGRGSPSQTRAALGVPADALVFTIVGNIIRYKGHLDLLAALEIAKGRLPRDWRLLIVGRDDGMGSELRARTAEAGLVNNVVFLGARDDVPALLDASDAGILCSYEEGFSNAVLEGMVAGLPMIVTDVGGNPEAVTDGVTGLVVPSHDPKRLGDAIVRLASDPALRQRFGSAGRERVAEHFGLEKCLQKYDEFYRALLAGRTPREIPAVQVAGGRLSA